MTTESERVEKVRGWLTGRLPRDWFEGPVEVTVDREEITIVGRLAGPSVAPDASDAERAAAVTGRITQSREESRKGGNKPAGNPEPRPRRKVAWGVEIGDRRELFTTLAMPVMTRLRQPERQGVGTAVGAAGGG